MLDSTKPLGPQWFKHFRYSIFKDHYEEMREDWGDGKVWSNHMFAFLRQLGGSLGYSVPSTEQGRRDQVWKRGNSIEVHIEHENNGTNLDYLLAHEIRDLAATDAKLKILITYVHYKDYPGERYAKKLDEFLGEPRTLGQEWLLVVAPYNDIKESAEFIAYHYFPAFSRTLLVASSTEKPK